ncbi:MAG: hypothetical protein IJ630_06760 [Treponema sp.]|nr:hypothetical protein [Treponema sp.]
MPIPFLIAGLGIAAGAIGAGSHIKAKQTNERANEISADAQRLYNNAKNSLEAAKRNTTFALREFEYAKKDVLDSSMKQFLRGYERVKHIELKTSEGMNEISSFILTPQDTLQIRELTNIYESSLKTGAIGAGVGVAAFAGVSSLGFLAGAAATPLAAIAAPVLLFTGISASMKADENLEKAQVMYSEATAAAESMKISETKCKAITKRTEMFHDLLDTLNIMFAQSAVYLDSVTRKKKGFFGLRKITSNRLTEQEINLIAVSRALAGAVKAVIDMPVLSEKGELDSKSNKKYNEVKKSLPLLTDQSNTAQSYDYHVRLKKALKAKRRR